MRSADGCVTPAVLPPSRRGKSWAGGSGRKYSTSRSGRERHGDDHVAEVAAGYAEAQVHIGRVALRITVGFFGLLLVGSLLLLVTIDEMEILHLLPLVTALGTLLPIPVTLRIWKRVHSVNSETVGAAQQVS